MAAYSPSTINHQPSTITDHHFSLNTLVLDLGHYTARHILGNRNTSSVSTHPLSNILSREAGFDRLLLAVCVCIASCRAVPVFQTILPWDMPCWITGLAGDRATGLVAAMIWNKSSSLALLLGINNTRGMEEGIRKQGRKNNL